MDSTGVSLERVEGALVVILGKGDVFAATD